MSILGTLKGIAAEVFDLQTDAEREKQARIIGGTGDWVQPVSSAVKEENPAVVIENVPGVGISVTNGNGKELIVREHSKDKVEIWRTDERGKVTGKPLIAQREGEAAYLINERLR